MRIAGLSPVLQQALLAALPKAAEAFRVGTGIDGPASPPAALPPALPATSVQMLVALAAAEPRVERRRREAAVADRGLALLEGLHAELLVGAPAPERLQELVEWSESFTVPDDPQLAGLAREIEVRVRVELAKYELRV